MKEDIFVNLVFSELAIRLEEEHWVSLAVVQRCSVFEPYVILECVQLKCTQKEETLVNMDLEKFALLVEE